MSFVQALKRNGYAVPAVAKSKANAVFAASNLMVRHAVTVLTDNGLTTSKDFAGTPASPAKSMFNGIDKSGSLDSALWSVRTALERNYFLISVPFVKKDGKKGSVKVTLAEITRNADHEVSVIQNAIAREFPGFELNPLDPTGKFNLPEETRNEEGAIDAPGMSGELVVIIDTLAKAVRKQFIAPALEECEGCTSAEEVRAVLHRILHPKTETANQ